MQGPRHRCRSERGAVVLEMALVAPLLLALLLGITSGGQAYSTKVTMVGAVREGARFGATLQLGTGPTAVSDFEASVVDRVVSSSAGRLAPGDVCVRLVLPHGTVDCGLADPAGASAQPSVHVVKVSATKATTLQFFFAQTRPTLNEKLSARYERDTG